MKKYFSIPVFFGVLCQFCIFANSLYSQQKDSSKSMVFVDSKTSENLTPSGPRFGGIVSANFGAYSGFHDIGLYSSILQPNLGIEFLAEPGGPLGFLIGARFGVLSSVTTEVSVGLRDQIATPNRDIRLFGDLSIIFFHDAGFIGPYKYGARLAFGARTLGNLDIEYRLAGEWRGKGFDSIDGYRSRMLWWVGAEVGIGFSLFRVSKPLTRKDSLHAALQYIASGEEMEDLDSQSSDERLDRWLDRFWRIRDLTPDTKLNEARIEYEKRVEEANRIYSHGKTLGIQTDPGRVLAIYGQPDLIDEDHSAYNDQEKYILWIYYGRLKTFSFATFLFANTSSTNNWQQIYSNVAGELGGYIPDGLPKRLRSKIENTQ